MEQSDVTLFIDGIPQKQGPFINPIEVKSGEHLIEIRDQQGKVFRRKVQFKAGQTETLEVDLLQSSFFTRKRVSFTLLSAGGASLIAGMVSSFLAASASGDLEECRTQFACARKQGELDLAQDVRGYALSADIFTGLGVLLGAGGGILYWLDQSQTTTVPQVQVVPNGAGATAITQFTF